jgi:signal transduction histidine kinase
MRTNEKRFKGLNRLSRLLQAITSKHKTKKIPEAYSWHIFKELEDSLNLIEDFDQIALNFTGKIREIIPINKQILLIYDQDLGRFKACTSIGFEKLEVQQISFFRNDPLVKWLKVNEALLYLKRQPGVLKFLSRKETEILTSLGIEICYPLISMNRLIGILLLGPKESGEDFSGPELSFISSLAPQAGIALENALLYKEQRERFRRMSRADKLATIGELAAGAAHEIRNPLTAIKSSLQFLEKKSQDDTTRKILASALQETARIENILSALLSFSRPSELKKERHNIIDTLEEILELISFQARTQKIHLVRDLASSPLYIHGDKSQLKQLFLNIFLNALQAMPNGGELKVDVIPKNDQRVLIAIADTGEGISEENLDRMFDPFFTTKKGGTGLGLSICYNIVKSHHGEIEIKSKVKHGTTALITLPFKG